MSGPLPGDGPPIFSAEYYRRIHAHESRYWWHVGMRDLAARLLRRHLRVAPRIAFDVGCGTGATLRWLQDLFPAARCFGVDIATLAIETCRADGVCRTTVGSALRLPFADARGDLVVSLDLLQHLPLPIGDRVALAEMRRVLRPGGHLLLRTNARRGGTAVDEEASFRIYDPPDLRERLEASGFETITMSRVNFVGSLVQDLGVRARDRASRARYTGLPLAPDVPASRLDPIKRALLSLEGRWIAAGGSLGIGRSAVLLARAG